MTEIPERLPPLSLTPGPRRADPLPDDRPVGWGILATGKIASSFATNLALLPECRLAAVGARRLESAQSFAASHGVESAYGDYRAVAEDPAVDVVYVATPHALHEEHVRLAFEAGKPVLCEKALTLDAASATRLVTEANERGLFFMEAMWMRCIPMIRRVRELVGSGVLGEVRQVRADLGWRVEVPPTDRLLDPALGGGALLDMGVYVLTFAQLFLGEPSTVRAAASLSEAGVDLDVALALGYPTGAVASLTTTMTAVSPRSASIATDLGRMDIEAPFHHPTRVTWTGEDEAQVRTLEAPLIGTGLAHEAHEVVRCLRNGETESPLVPLADTVATLRLIDRIRAEIGVSYAVSSD